MSATIRTNRVKIPKSDSDRKDIVLHPIREILFYTSGKLMQKNRGRQNGYCPEMESFSDMLS